MNIQFTDLDHGYAAFATKDIPVGNTGFLDETVEKSFQSAKSNQDVIGVGASLQKWKRWGWNRELPGPRFSGEPPVVCMQSSESRLSLPYRVCPTCLTPEIELEAELERWFTLLDHHATSSDTSDGSMSGSQVKEGGKDHLYQSMMQEDASPTVRLTEIGIISSGATTSSTPSSSVGMECGLETCCGLLAEVVGNEQITTPRALWFCCEACHDAFRLGVHRSTDEDDEEEDRVQCQVVTSEDVLHGTGFAHEDRIAELSLRQVLEQLRFVRQTFDERIWLVFLLLRAIVKTLEEQHAAREVANANREGDENLIEKDEEPMDNGEDCGSASQDSLVEAPSLHAAVSAFTERYDWGRLAMPTDGQRAVIRYAHRLFQRYLDFVQSCEVAFQQDLALQDVFQLRCALDANVHEVIVVNPIWAWSRLVLESVSNEAADSMANTKVRSALAIETIQKLLPLDCVHTFGVALFNVASKLNHSCSPNAKMLPTTAPCRGILRAVRPIACGAEIRISYLNLDEDDEGTTQSSESVSLPLESVLLGSAISKVEKQRLERNLMQNVSLRLAKLRATYGFECDCSRCETELKGLEVQDEDPNC
jgi:hypothetical protein